MKKIFNTPGKLLILISVVLFVVFWAVWFFAFRYYLIWLEGYSYFSALPDFSSLYKNIPEGLPGYVGAFLHQFYAVPALGAAIQAFFTVWPSVCIAIIFARFFKEPVRLMWIALIPMVFIAGRQFWDLYMYHMVIWSAVSTVLMLAAVLATCFFRPEWSLPKMLRNTYLNLIVMLLLVANPVYVVTSDPRNRQYEDMARLEYYGERGQWDRILKTVQPKDARADEFKRHYALLALSEKGLLADYGFVYGLQSQNDFVFYDRIDPMCLNFNALFYQCLDMHNAVIHQAYQQGVQSVTGVSFASLRRLADTYLELKDYELAKKYLDILSHSTCHKKWVRTRLPELEAIRNVQPAYETDPYKAAIANFSHTISSMVDRNRDNRKYADLLLCSLLASQEGAQFKDIFRYIAQIQYPEGTSVPRLYEEALLLSSTVDPTALQGLTISQETRKRFADFVALMNSGKGNQALRKYADSYWAYTY